MKTNKIALPKFVDPIKVTKIVAKLGFRKLAQRMWIHLFFNDYPTNRRWYWYL